MIEPNKCNPENIARVLLILGEISRHAAAVKPMLDNIEATDLLAEAMPDSYKTALAHLNAMPDLRVTVLEPGRVKIEQGASDIVEVSLPNTDFLPPVLGQGQGIQTDFDMDKLRDAMDNFGHTA